MKQTLVLPLCNEATTVLQRLYIMILTSAMKQRQCCRGFTYYFLQVQWSNSSAAEAEQIFIYKCNKATAVLQRLCAMKQILLLRSWPSKWASKAVNSMVHSFIFWHKMAFQISSVFGHVRQFSSFWLQFFYEGRYFDLRNWTEFKEFESDALKVMHWRWCTGGDALMVTHWRWCT